MQVVSQHHRVPSVYPDPLYSTKHLQVLDLDSDKNCDHLALYRGSFQVCGHVDVDIVQSISDRFYQI